MSISSITYTPATSASTNSISSVANAAPTVDYNQFLKLLVTELQHQDPTSPTDPTQYMSQLASFSAVEQQVQTNATLDALLTAQASSMIGKTLTSADGKTSGVVVSVELAQGGGANARLADGSVLTIGPGVTVSQS